MSLYDPNEHRALGGGPWSETAARDAIAEITADAVGAYGGPERLWPNHPADLDAADEDRPYRNAYLGAAGVAWALHRLAGEGHGPALPGIDELTATLHADYLAAPELTELETGAPSPPPSLFFGESGILLALEAIVADGDSARHDALHACIARNARNPTVESCWGSPGTLLAAEAMWRAGGEDRWAQVWRDGAGWLLEQWREPVWEQHLYGEVRRFVGAGHGFAGNAMTLLRAGELLDDDVRRDMTRRITQTTITLAVRDPGDGGVAQWPGLAGVALERRPLQWCHGSPGIVIALDPLPAAAAPELDELLIAGGELTWRAGPLRKGVGLCHGTAGNGFALLTLHHHTGDERWLARARAFAADAAADVRAWRERHGRGRYSLFTGDVGVALLLRACLDPAAGHRFPFLTDAL